MHASQQLRDNHFGVLVNGREAAVREVLPDWTGVDRIGVVIHEPFGGLGASMLIQAGISRFYDYDPDRRHNTAQYPPIFMFHVGGRYGDHSSMDFWPGRREVFLPADPYEVLGAIRDRAITRLFVPEGPNIGLSYAYEAPSGWTDIHSAQEQTASAFVYSPSGKVSEHDVQLSAKDVHVDDMVTDVLEIEALIDRFEQSTDQDLLDLELGPSTPPDFHGWLKSFKSREGEVPLSVRQEILAARREAISSGNFIQTYRNVPVQEALGRLVPRPKKTNNSSVLDEETTRA
ncbi:hypothetical protein [Pseudarthrobacter sp. YAF2]|uniref:hypothetical protein n=1 Tax=Pseudarthrobacter sp. YAF2 TaxID=3233078 RepID=UPI003F9D5746